MYSVEFFSDETWTLYSTNLTAAESTQMGRMLTDLGYEVRILEHARKETEVDYLMGAVKVLEQEAAVSRYMDSSVRLFRMREELLRALLRERSGDIRYITPAPADVPEARD